MDSSVFGALVGSADCFLKRVFFRLIVENTAIAAKTSTTMPIAKNGEIAPEERIYTNELPFFRGKTR